MRTTLTLLLLTCISCSDADVPELGTSGGEAVSSATVSTPVPYEPTRFEPGPAHTRADHLGLAPDDWEAPEREPLGIGQLRTAAGEPLVLLHTDIHADVSAGIAIVDIAQHYTNPFDHTIDTEYALPLPPDAAVRAFRLRCGDRVIEGEIHEREAAREMYEQARREGKKAALLEQMRENLFTQRVAGICPGEDVVVTTQYVQQVHREDGLNSLAFPTTVGERYDAPADLKVPAHVSAPARGGRDVNLTLTIDEGMPVASLWSDSHDIDIWTEDSWGLVVTLDDSDDVPNKDIALTWDLAGEEPRAAAVIAPPTEGEDGYIALTLEPAVLEDLARQKSRELFFVMDSSGSMRGRPWQASVATVVRALEQMDGDDTFNLVLYSSNAKPLWPEPRPATAGNIAEARTWIQYPGNYMGGGTEIATGIRAALAQPGDAEAQRLMLLLTDGYIGSEAELGAMVRRERGDARIFSLGVGSSPNRLLLETLAEAGGGTAAYHLNHTPIQATVDTFYRRIANSPMTHVVLDWGDLEVTEVYPSRIPDPWAGQPVRVVARYTSDGGVHDLTIDSRVDGEELSIPVTIDLAEAEENEAVRTLWARRKIHDITWDLAKVGPQQKAEILPLALEYHLVSAYTSLVAVETRPSTCAPAERTFEVAHYGPEGSRLDTPAAAPSTPVRPRPRPRPSPARRYAPAPSPSPRPAPMPARDPEPEPAVVAAEEPMDPTPVLMPGSLTVSGELQTPDVNRNLLRALHRLSCTGGSTVQIALTVEGGAVASVTLSGGDATARACVESWARGLRLGSGSGTVRFSIR